jgi:sugar-specific transcriptional regulator TrmB
MIITGNRNNNIDENQPEKINFSRKKLAKLKKSFQSIDSRLNKAIDTGNLVSQNLDKFLSLNVPHSPTAKQKKSKLQKIPNNHILVGKMFNINSYDSINGNFSGTPNRLKSISKHSPSNKQITNKLDMIKYMNMIGQMNWSYSQNKRTQSISSNQFNI